MNQDLLNYSQQQHFPTTTDFGLRSFRWPEILAWVEISGRKLRIFQRGGEEWEGDGGGGEGGVNGLTLAHPVLFGNPGRRWRTWVEITEI